MSINFERPIDDETIELMREAFGTPVASDRRQFLFDKMSEIRQADMKKIANSAKQPAFVEINSEGEIKTLSDGTRYQVTANGWRKLPE